MEEAEFTWERASDTPFWFPDRWNPSKRTVPHRGLAEELGPKVLPSSNPFPLPHSFTLSFSLGSIWKSYLIDLSCSNHGISNTKTTKRKLRIYNRAKEVNYLNKIHAIQSTVGSLYFSGFWKWQELVVSNSK